MTRLAAIEAWSRGRRAAELDNDELRDMVRRLVGICENHQARIEALERRAPSTAPPDDPTARR